MLSIANLSTPLEIIPQSYSLTMSQDDTEQISDGERSCFTATLHRMVTIFSKTSPELGGWSSCGKMFYFDPFTDEDAMKKAIAPFFSRK